MKDVNDYEIGIEGMTGNIVIGKTKPIVVDGKEDEDISEWVEMSEDRTREAILAVIKHMAIRLQGRKEVSYEIPGNLKLTLEDLSKEK